MSSKESDEVMEMPHQYVERVAALEAQIKEHQEHIKVLKWQHQVYEMQMDIERHNQERRIEALEKQLQELLQEQTTLPLFLQEILQDEQRQATLPSSIREVLLPPRPAPTSNQPQQPPPPPPAVAQAAASAAATQAAPLLTITHEQEWGRGPGRGRGRGHRRGRHERHYRIQGMDFWGSLRYVTSDGVTMEL
ncbi:hypothetical protein T069G_09252 [Trichoderma breve]|uniref:Uncharacterized protein n=1 Tax=Trichoderma breve TaxID=2034170 RepID=A0A9W9B513_9HYPO|nr:hypothetical protein T069G_09252 [Trichoderma breve]KAJ4855884.1 hypothetical protein T069G_09252 [Trichoderma breve]